MDFGTYLRGQLARRSRTGWYALGAILLSCGVAAASMFWWQRAAIALVAAPMSSFVSGPFRIADTSDYSISGIAYEAPDSPASLGGGITVRGFQVGEGGADVTFRWPGHSETWDVEAGTWIYVYSDALGVFKVALDNGGPL